MNILLISSHQSQGGVVNLFDMMIPRLDPSITLETLFIGRRPDERRIAATLLRVVTDWLRFAIIVLRTRYDVIHLNPALSPRSAVRHGAFLLLLKLAPRRGVLVYFHGWQISLEHRIAANPLYRALFVWLYGGASRILVLSERFRRGLIAMGCSADRVETVTTMFDGEPLRRAQADLGPGHERRTILFLSRFVQPKGCFELLEAYARIEGRYPQFELVMAGAGDEEAELRRAAVELGIGGRVRFPGYLQGLEKARALLEARIYVLATTHFEGLPVALMEAMGAGNAVITTRAGGIADVFEDPDNGILLDEVTVDGIAAALERLLTDDAYCAAIGERNAAKAWALYEADIVTKRVEAAYARAAASAGTANRGSPRP